MANLTKGKLLRWEAADTTGFDHAIHIAAIIWSSTEDTNRDIADDDDLQITDYYGAELIDMRAKGEPEGPMFQIAFPYPGYPIAGIKVPALDGGELFIWTYNEISNA